MSEPSEHRSFRTPAFEYADKLLAEEVLEGKQWTERQEREVLRPLARELVGQGGDATLKGMQLAAVFEDEKNQVNVFAHAIRTSDDPAVRHQALEYILEARRYTRRSEDICAEGLMIAARSADKDVATQALTVAMTEFDNETNQNLVFGEGLLSENEEAAHLALNIARTIRSERRLGSLLRTGLRSVHPAVRDRCLNRAQTLKDLAARNRVLRFAESLGLIQ